MRTQKLWILLLAAVLLSPLAGCGGGGGGGGDGDAGPTAATEADLANTAFAFTADQGLFDGDVPPDPREGQGAVLTFGAFNGTSAAFTLVSDDGSILGGTVTLGSCTLHVAFQQLAGDVLETADPTDPDNSVLLDPCEVDSEGRLSLTDEEGITFTSGLPTTPQPLVAMTVPLATTNEVPNDLANLALLEGRTETGTAMLTLYHGNLLSYSLTVSGLAAGDALANAHIHGGSVTENGGVLITLAGAPAQTARPASTIPQFGGGTSVSGSAALTAAEVADLTDPDSDHYVNAHSTQVPSGLVRGQLGETIAFAANVALGAANEVPPPAGRTETGLAVLRAVSDDTPSLKYSLVVNDLAAEDSLAISHIHDGDSASTGGIFITLVGGPEQPPTRPAAEIPAFDGQTSIRDQVAVTAAEIAALNDPTRPLYVNIHSALVGAGIVRGQIRDADVVGFAAELQPILTTSCAISSACHVANGAAPMTLAAGQARGALVDQPATSFSSTQTLRVAPGDAEGSELIRRLTVTNSSIRMPLGGAPLSASNIALFRTWIDNGAPDN